MSVNTLWACVCAWAAASVEGACAYRLTEKH